MELDHILAFLYVLIATSVSYIRCDESSTLSIHDVWYQKESGDSLYRKNLLDKTDETILCIDQYYYLHPNTERYLVAKLQQMLHTLLNTYGKSVRIFPRENESERDTEHRLHSAHLKKTLFQIVENWYLNMVIFTYGRLYHLRRELYNVTDDYENSKKKDIKRFWDHDYYFFKFFNQIKGNLRNIIRFHYLNLEKAFYEYGSIKLMHTSFMNSTLAPHTLKFTQVFAARHGIVDFFHDTPSTCKVKFDPTFIFSLKTEKIIKMSTTPTTPTTFRIGRILNISQFGITFPKRQYRRTRRILQNELIKAADYYNRTDIPYIKDLLDRNQSLNW